MQTCESRGKGQEKERKRRKKERKRGRKIIAYITFIQCRNKNISKCYKLVFRRREGV